ncbi:16S rRNA (uracil(1498)-N(3))-methyltransferase [Borrelia anserina]|uniref:Ribosomal RNA small subunit methyltransferase E n=2 Tax=Borrelia anserina TaxID=143 RepID=W5SN60_BORAN|nr:16S rRNA (uracil(1498)-N(3))-methyltransferase [Borrelia anserina]AHH08325.1 Putative cytosolic protein [Borrelia anserina BA2]APR64834.1 16S rRNA methyltransferase [Borrelia anserina Es]UPA06749.1 16S rRNA (uracil(1498)-N(3))-methyltransferase [Borrelia anserina]
MKQIVLDDSCLFDDDIIIDDFKMYHYLVDVRRFKVGDTLSVLLKGKEVRFAEISSINNNVVRLSTLRVEKLNKRDFEINMFISNLKGRKLDLSLRQVVEIGVDQINIVNADNSVARIDMDNLEFKSSRFLKLIDEALKQSGNTRVPGINFYKDFFSIPYSSSVDYYVAHKEGVLLRCGDDLGTFGKIGILVGPEGCFSKSEVNLFKKLNFKFVRFNTPILRADTAIVYSLAHFKLLLEGKSG